MIHRVTVALALALAFAFTACTRKAEIEHHTFFALGTVVQVSLPRALDDHDATLRGLESLLLAREQRWRAWNTGELAMINRRLSAGETIELPPAIARDLQRANVLAQQSGGRFNPGIGKLVELWGFHQEERRAGSPPGLSGISALLPAPTLDALVETGSGWKSTDPRLWIDMGGFAKGLALEEARDWLASRNVAVALVNAGGDLIALGAPANRRWRIGIRHPRDAGMIATLEANGAESVFTTGDYERTFEWDGQKFHHILDPATGWPAEGVLSVTVLHRDAALADAAATALFVAGDDWPHVARALEVEHALVVRADERIEVTRAMHERLSYAYGDESFEIVSP